MKTAIKKISNILNSANIRPTQHRLAILSTLLTAKTPMTQQQITDKLANNPPNKVTIYRILENLLNAGIIHKAFLTNRTWHFELANHCTKTQCHPHFTCTNCDNTHCMTDMKIPMPEKIYKGFKINHQKVNLQGLCPKCSKINK